ncbi:rhamnogalacturonase A [Guyanagaster necrorhizus]|uniref:Rhamnogalacturonase A n=1 Tax=Guyanagaster necrorhizus TaxID=856835 RepID=A0A9P7W0N5_9AGAR|nr:rhamnogalacturonase A [Guyanagaster necrorhizus MCA 3950]KAG7449201.1 rhamnogalacturonase A [Guyanagaster necrorhizus MCA 3950]
MIQVSGLAFLFLLPVLIAAQLSGSVGPLTSYSAKAAVKTCDVTDYGAVADLSTDLGTALASAFAACQSGGLVVIPQGDYALSTWVTLSGGSAWALQLDGTIYRTGTDAGNMIFIEHTSDFELFSSTSSGAVQGYGYEYHVNGSLSGPRILRLYDVSDFSVHDIALVDAPSFHFSMDTCSNGEVYNMAIRGGNSGGLDGIDVWSTNMWIHDVMVTNKDECVTVKSPAKNILVESTHCNWSGGCAIGSLGSDTDIADVIYRNIYTIESNQMMMIKSNGGSGSVSNVVFENFIGHSNAYSLDVDQYWSSISTVAGDGVSLSNMTFSNWSGTCASGTQRGPIKFACADGAPCTDMTVTDFNMWTDSGSSIYYTCRSAFGDGACLKDGSASSYAVVTETITSAPSSYSAPTLPDDLTTNFGTTASIPIPTIPTSFYPGVTPISALLGNDASSKRSIPDVVSATASASATYSLITFSTSSTLSSLSTSTPIGESFGRPRQEQGGRESSGADNHERRLSKKRHAGLDSVLL